MNLGQDPVPRPLAVVLVSGGMDSLVWAAIATQTHEPAFLHLNYGQRTEKKELSCFNALAGHYGVKRRLVIDASHLSQARLPRVSCGAGAMDDKLAVMGLLEAVEALLKRGFQPLRTVYLAFGHDEEVSGGRGAAQIASLLKSRGIELEYVLDEGLAIVHNVLPILSKPIALIGLAEKGYLSLELTAECQGGHSSTPPQDTAIGALSTALHRLGKRPFPARLGEPIQPI